jgi:hypothetical protein
MITPVLIQLFDEALSKLTEEINAYPDDASLWVLKEGINNTGGNLCLHITGALQHFFGAVLNESGFVRNRDAEFSLKNIAKVKLLNGIEEAKVSVKDTLEQVSKKQLDKSYPLPINGEMINTEYFLVKQVGHINYHIGQINYHRRLLTAQQ